MQYLLGKNYCTFIHVYINTCTVELWETPDDTCVYVLYPGIIGYHVSLIGSVQ